MATSNTPQTPQAAAATHQVKWADVEAAQSQIEKIRVNIGNVINLKGAVITEEFLPDIMKNIFDELNQLVKKFINEAPQKETSIANLDEQLSEKIIKAVTQALIEPLHQHAKLIKENRLQSLLVLKRHFQDSSNFTAKIFQWFNEAVNTQLRNISNQSNDT